MTEDTRVIYEVVIKFANVSPKKVIEGIERRGGHYSEIRRRGAEGVIRNITMDQLKEFAKQEE